MITILIIYLIGCIFSYGRLNASIYEIQEPFGIRDKNVLTEPHDRYIAILFIVLSWFGFAVTTNTYFKDNEKYFLRFKNWK